MLTRFGRGLCPPLCQWILDLMAGTCLSLVPLPSWQSIIPACTILFVSILFSYQAAVCLVVLATSLVERGGCRITSGLQLNASCSSRRRRSPGCGAEPVSLSETCT